MHPLAGDLSYLCRKSIDASMTEAPLRGCIVLVCYFFSFCDPLLSNRVRTALMATGDPARAPPTMTAAMTSYGPHILWLVHLLNLPLQLSASYIIYFLLVSVVELCSQLDDLRGGIITIRASFLFVDLIHEFHDIGIISHDLHIRHTKSATSIVSFCNIPVRRQRDDSKGFDD